MKKKLTCILLLLLSLLNVSLIAQENLVRNGDFEELAGGVPRFWRTGGWKQSTSDVRFSLGRDDPYSGESYAVIENLTSNDARLMQTLQVEPLSFYKLSCYIRANAEGSGKIAANIGIFDADFQHTSRSFFDTRGEWVYVELVLKTAEHTRGITICARLGGYSSDLKGRAEFDDFRVVKLENPGSAEVVAIPGMPVTDPNAGDSGNGSSSPGMALLIILLGGGIVILLAVVLINKFKHGKGSGAGAESADLSAAEKGRYTVLDYILCGVITLVYAIVAFTNLGSFSAPQTHWWPGSPGEGFTADLGSVQTIRRVYYFEGLPSGHAQGSFTLEYSEDGENWVPYQTYKIGSIFFWFFDQVNFRARYIKITAETAKFQLKEMAFYGEDQSRPLEIKGFLDVDPGPYTRGRPENVFDEQDTVAFRPTMLYGMPTGFDELYHARTAYEFIVKVQPYESTHPPLGKVLISLGIRIFGMNPFGWRFIGTLLGVVIVVLMYMLGKQLFKRTEFAFICAFLMAFDFMHFVQTRIATIDTYGVFFIILMYYFMFQYYSMDFYKVEFKKTLLPLLFAGICWGLGAASKWIAIYAAIGLAVLFFVTLGRRLSDYFYYQKRLKSSKYKKGERARLEAVQSRFVREILLTLGWCVLVFIFIPAVIYVLSYIPFVEAQGRSFSLREVINQQRYMYNYHAEGVKTATHPFSSPWYEWPLIWKPMWYHSGQYLPADKTENLVAMGNPAVWWLGSIAALLLIVYSAIVLVQRLIAGQSAASPGHPYTFRKFVMQITAEDRVRFFILVGLASQYLPWVIAPRKLTFIYHFFASVPFIILSLVYMIKDGKEKLESQGKSAVLVGNFVIYFYLAVVLVLFIMFYPVLAYKIVDKSYMKLLKWLPQWPIYY